MEGAQAKSTADWGSSTRGAKTPPLNFENNVQNSKHFAHKFYCMQTNWEFAWAALDAKGTGKIWLVLVILVIICQL